MENKFIFASLFSYNPDRKREISQTSKMVQWWQNKRETNVKTTKGNKY